MAVLTYNGVQITFARTMFWDSQEVMSDDGVDYLYTHVTLSVVGIVNPFTLSPQNKIGTTGQQLGAMMAADLKEVLMSPRKKLIFTVGNTTVVEVPKDSAAVPPTSSTYCDANNGPNPLSAKILDITGDKTALVSFSIEFWLSDCSKIVLSNRWTVQSITDENAKTVRLITGIAKLRADLMQRKHGTADNYRGAYFPTCPDQFKRDLISATLSSDGTELAYRLQDTELNLAIGVCMGQSSSGAGFKNLNVTKVEGAVTAGARLWNDTATGNIAATIFTQGVIRSSPFGLIPGAADAVEHFINRFSIPMAKAVVRVTGNRLALKSDLANVAAAVVMERLFIGKDFGVSILKGGVMVSAFLTQSIEERFVELVVEVMPAIKSQFAISQYALDFSVLMNLNNPITFPANPGPPPSPAVGAIVGATGVLGLGQGPAQQPQPLDRKVALDFRSGDIKNPTGPGPVMFGSNNDRGTWLGQLLVQGLGVVCEVPSAPQPNMTAVDLPLE